MSVRILRGRFVECVIVILDQDAAPLRGVVDQGFELGAGHGRRLLDDDMGIQRRVRPSPGKNVTWEGW